MEPDSNKRNNNVHNNFYTSMKDDKNRNKLMKTTIIESTIGLKNKHYYRKWQ